MIGAGRSPAVEHRTLSDAAHLEEALFTGLRLAGGVSLPALQARFGVDIWALKVFNKKIFMKILFAINVLNKKYFDNFSCINFI
jgi:coproporphyrinogen III oxidase-like Fe-S oxidoreductase